MQYAHVLDGPATIMTAYVLPCRLHADRVSRESR